MHALRSISLITVCLLMTFPIVRADDLALRSKDADLELAKLRHALCCDSCTSDLAIASQLLDLLRADRHFPARTPNPLNQTTFWKLLQESYRGRMLAARIRQVYTAVNYHPTLTEDQVILLKAAVHIAGNDSKAIKAVLSKAALLAGDISRDLDAKSEIVLPFYKVAQIASLENATSNDAIDARLQEYGGFSSRELEYLFDQGVVISESASVQLYEKERALAIKAEAGTPAVLGLGVFHRLRAADALALLTLLDANSDAITSYSTEFGWMQSVPNQAIASFDHFVKLASSISRYERANVVYAETIQTISDTSVGASADALLSKRRDLFGKNLAKLESSISTAIKDLFVDPSNVPSSLFELSLLVSW